MKTSRRRKRHRRYRARLRTVSGIIAVRALIAQSLQDSAIPLGSQSLLQTPDAPVGQPTRRYDLLRIALSPSCNTFIRSRSVVLNVIPSRFMLSSTSHETDHFYFGQPDILVLLRQNLISVLTAVRAL